MADLFDSSRQLGLDFLHAELQTGLTFAKLALSARYSDKIHRNQVNARKAYDSFLHYVSGFPLSEAESQELNEQSAELKQQLVRLGEAF